LAASIPAYEVTEILGRGGMGAVYKARQKSLKRWVAIKVLPLVAADDELQFAERFRNEAETMARMSHPAIVNVHDFGETSDGLLYIVMEFIDGTDVHRLIQGSGRLSEDYALAITAHVCDALAYAHARGVIHRDIKPANILIDQEGNVKVADFGLAKMSHPDLDYGLTRSNVAMGTPDYVAPEVLSYGMVADHRADLYAVGVMLYQMLTGEVPRGLFKLPSQKGIDADPRFDDIICKAMEPDRDERYQSAMDVRAALDVILTTALPKEDGTGVVPVEDVPPKVVAKGTRRSASRKNAGNRAPDDRARNPVKKGSSSSTMIVIGTIVTVLVVAVFLVFSKKGTSPAGVSASSQPVPPQSPITGAGKVDTNTAGATTQGMAPVPGPTIDWINALPGEASPWSSEWNLKDGVLAPGTQLRQQFGLMKDGSVRLRVRLTPDHPETSAYGPQLQLTIRSGSLAGTSGRTGHMQFQTYVPGHTASLHFQEKTTPGLPVEQVLAGKPQGISELDSREVEWEFRAVGDEYSAWADGQLVATVRDARIASGYCTLEVRPGIEITLLETTGLTPTKPGPSLATAIPASPPNITNWQDVTEAMREKARSIPDLVVEDDQVRHVGQGASPRIQLSPDGLRDYAVRLHFTGESQVNLRRDDFGFIYVLCQRSQTIFQRYNKDKANPTVLIPTLLHPPGYDSTQPHELLVTMEGSTIRTWLDGRFLGEAHDDTLANGCADVAFTKYCTVQKVEFAELERSPSVTSANWQPLFTKPEDFGTDAAKIEIRDGWLFANTAKTHYAPTDSIDGAIRATLRFYPQHTADLTARANDGAPWGKEAYACSVFITPDGKTATIMNTMEKIDGEKPWKRHDFPLPAVLREGEEFALELRVEGDQIAVLFNGKELGSVTHPFPATNRHFGIMTSTTGVSEFRDVAWQALP
jgi:serine/threonine protein kinase